MILWMWKENFQYDRYDSQESKGKPALGLRTLCTGPRGFRKHVSIDPEFDDDTQKGFGTLAFLARETYQYTDIT